MNQGLYWLWRVLPMPKWLRSCLMWFINRKFVVGTAALILNERGEILLFKHFYRKDTPWGFPGGYLRRGESPQDAIQREIQEESGFHIKIHQLLEVIQSLEMARIEVLFLGELIGKDDFIPSTEVIEARFFDVNQLPALLPEHEAILRRHIYDVKR